MNAEELKRRINVYARKESPKYPEDVWYELDNWFSHNTQIDAETSIVLVECEMGGEDVFGGGEGDIYITFQVASPDGLQYFKKTGKYYSFAGREWAEDFKEVVPRQRLVTYYE